MTVPGKQRWALDPKVDLVFFLLFGAERNRKLLIALLEEVLHPDKPVEALEVLPPRPDPAEVEEKLVFLDLRLRLAGGEQIDVEMQTRRHPALRARVLFYWGRMYTSQIRRGDPYTGLKRCVVILIASFKELDSPSFHSVFQARERSSGKLLTDHLELHLIELPKLRSASVEAGERGLAGWCRFLVAETDEELEQLAMQNPILREAKLALDELSADPEARERADRRHAELLLLEYGAALQREEGRAEGRAEGKREIAHRQLAAKFGPLPTEVEARLQIATELELDRWLQRLVSADSLQTILESVS